MLREAKPLPREALGGKWLVFTPTGQVNLGEPTFTITSRRGGFQVGYVEFRNQWQDWSVKFAGDAVLNRACLAETYVFLKTRESNAQRRRATWRAAVRDWVLRWL